MILPLLLTAVLAPQDKVPDKTPSRAVDVAADEASDRVSDRVSDKVRELHRTHGAAAEVGAAEKRLAGLGEGRLTAARTPQFATALRAAGTGASDLALASLRLDTKDADAHAIAERAMALTSTLWSGAAPQRGAPIGKLDLRDFEQQCEHAFRELRRALGSGRDLTKEAPRLQGAVEQLRKDTSNLSQLSRDDEALIEERLDRAEGVDQDAILALARQLVLAALALDRPELVERLRRQEARKPRSIAGIEGDVLSDRDTDFGRIVFGGFGRNVYDCSQVEVIVDLGGDDEYRGPVGGAEGLRRMAVVIDLSGDDVYQALNDGLGSATFGLGILIDVAGNDRYSAERRSAGFGAAGVGVFMDLGGDDQMELGDQCGGVGFLGVGLFVDGDGDDVQRAGVQSFGCGLPGGLGLLVDVRGKDHRTLGREDKSVTEGGQESVSVGFGAGVGVLPLLSGGLGCYLDLGGDDRYEAAGIALGAGLRGGVGIFRDALGDDVYRAGVASLAAAYGQGVGVFLDDSGADDYQGSHLCLGSASAGGMAFFVDARGDDLYAALAPALGEASLAGISAFCDLGGKDRFRKIGSDGVFDLGHLRVPDGLAVGVFLHEGGAVDEFSFTRAAVPRNGETRRVGDGEESGLDVLILADR